MLNEFERLDDLQLNGLKLIQDTRYFCFGVDAVLLSDFVTVKPGATVLDVGSSTGIIPILLSAKTKARAIYGIEYIKHQYKIFERNIELNKLDNKIMPVWGDFKNYQNYFKKSQFDNIICNPPYKKPNSGIVNPHDFLAIARHEITITLEDIIKNSAELLNFGGKLTLINRPERLCDIFCLMRKYKIEPKKVRFVCPNSKKAPSMVMVEGAKSGNAFLKVMENLYIYNNDGSYTDEINRIYGR